MNVTASSRLEMEYSFKLSQADLDRFLADPQAWARETRAQLHPPTGGGGETVKSTRRGAVRRPTKGRKPKAPAKNGPGRRQVAAPGLVKVECPTCHELIASKYLALHQRAKHGHTGGSAPMPASAHAGAAGS